MFYRTVIRLFPLVDIKLLGRTSWVGFSQIQILFIVGVFTKKTPTENKICICIYIQIQIPQICICVQMQITVVVGGFTKTSTTNKICICKNILICL